MREERKRRGDDGEKGKNRQGQKQLDESVLIAAFWPEEDQSPKTRETDVKKNPPCDSFFSLSELFCGFSLLIYTVGLGISRYQMEGIDRRAATSDYFHSRLVSILN